MPTAASFKPGMAMVLSSLLVGIAVFLGVLLFGPETNEPDRRPFVRTAQAAQGNARNLVARGRDREAITLLLEHLKSHPDYAWGWMFTTQLCLRPAGNEADLAEKDQILDSCRSNLVRLSRESKLPLADANSNYTNFFIAGWAAWAAGDEPGANRAFLAGLSQIDAANGPEDGTYLYDGACFLALAGRVDEAADRIAGLARTGYTNLGWLRRDPDLDALHGHPVFEAAILEIERVLAQASIARESDEPRDSDSAEQDGP